MDRAILRTGEISQRGLIEQLLAMDAPCQFAFQSVVDLKRGIVTGYEALARFPEELGLRPDQVFQLAGQCGLRTELEARVATAALAHRVNLPPNCFLSINAGPVLLLSPAWDKVVADFGRLDAVVVEITEDEPVLDYRALRRRLDRIREIGGHLAVDDTGTGYASLKHVMELRPNFIKLDRFFVGGCHREPARAYMIEMLGNVACRMDAWIIAEGVETAEELDELMKLGVPLSQGFYTGRPDAEMRSLPVPLSEMIRRRAVALAANDLRRILERCLSCIEMLDAMTHLDTNSELRFVALTDSWGRPMHLLERHPLLGIRTIAEPLKVQLASDVQDVMHRALIRQPETRFDPLAIINEQGVFEGVVEVDRLMRLALELRSGSLERS